MALRSRHVVTLYAPERIPYLLDMRTHRRWTPRLGLSLAAVLLLAVAVPLAAQIPPASDPGASVRSRADLEELLRYYDDALLSPAYSQEVKASLSLQAARVRARLRDGDFRLGDRIVLSVQGEPTLPDTVPVQAGPKITLPLFGEISLSGVLRSEVQQHLTQALSAFLREPVVRAEGLMRVSVQGAVAQPGFYVVPADILLSETLMVAGGPAPTANLDAFRIDRGTEVLMEGDDLQEALRQGLSLDQLNLQAGDQLFVPQQGQGGLQTIGLVLGIVTSITLAIVQLSN